MKKINERECKCKRKSRWQFWIVKITVRLIIEFRADILDFLMNLLNLFSS